MKRLTDLLPIAIAVAAGAAVTAIGLDTRSLWLDEGSTFAIASQHGSALRHAVEHDGGNMIAYYLLMHVVIAWFGHAAWVLRLPSVVANAVTGGLVAAIALRLFADRRLAYAAGLLTVISLPLVFWGQDARGYALLVTLSVGSFLALAAILQTPAHDRPSRSAISAYVLTTLAALYVGYDVALLIPAQVALLLVFRVRARLVIGCLALVLMLCVPLLVLAAQRGSGQLFWVMPISWPIAQQAGVTLLSAGMPPNLHYTSTTLVTEAVTAVAVVAAIVLAARAALPAGRRLRSGPLLLVLSWAVVPSVVALVLYAAGEPIELSRITILVMPALALLLAWMLLQAGLAPSLGLWLCAALLVLRLAQLLPSYGVSSEPWNEVTAYVVAATPAAQPACVAFYPQDGREPFDYYLRELGQPRGNPAPSLRPILPSVAWTHVRPFVEVYGYGTLDAIRARPPRIARECPRVWLIGTHEGQAHGTARSRTNLTRYRQLERGFAQLYPNSTLRTFGWASPINVSLYYR
ncbi:MAG TPA: glycosyltransferase family 39 protein [Solirubrobacteraceae bacterium]|nr:glycosyltransferase family 39 protein [Solirubrobacteraceae bacterium]